MYHLRPVALRRALACCVFAVGAFAAPRASAFCRTTTCPDCPRDPATGCPTGGKPVFWPRSCVSFSLNVAGSSQFDLGTLTAWAHEAFATWNAVTCGPENAPIAIQAQDAFGPVACDHIEYNVEGGNANVILFREDEWPYKGVGNTLALTTVTYDANTGEIHDADMEINGTNEFLQPGIKGIEDYDLLSIMTHEAGHFLGLAHTQNTLAVMQTTLSPQVVRTALADDDIAGICAIYPPGPATTACDFAPIGGFSPLCGLDSINGGACESAGPPRRGDAGSSAWAAAMLGLVPWIVRARRAGKSPRRAPASRGPQ